MNFRAISTMTISVFALFTQLGFALQVVFWNNSENWGIHGTWDEVWINIGYAKQIPPLYSLFDSIALKPDNVGQTFNIASAADDPDFDPFSARLTDGITQSLMITLSCDGGGGVGRFLPESTWFSGASPDAVGYTIGRYDLTINELSITAINDWTDFSVDYTLQVYGTPIPDPATGALLILGALSLTGRIFRRRTPQCATVR